MNIQEKSPSFEKFREIVNVEAKNSNKDPTYIEGMVEFFKNNQEYLKNSKAHDEELGDNILILSKKIRSTYPNEILVKNNAIKNLVKKLESFGVTRKVTRDESRGYVEKDDGRRMIPDKNILSHVMGHLEPQDLKNISTVSKEWKASKDNLYVTIQSINNHPEIPIMKYFKNYDDLKHFLNLHGNKLTAVNLFETKLTTEQIKELNIEKLENLKSLSIPTKAFTSHKELDNFLSSFPNQSVSLDVHWNHSAESLKDFLKIHGDKVKSLNLNGMKFIPQEFDEFRIENLKNLESLQLFNTTSADLLDKVGSLNKLRSLSFKNCPNITDEELAKLSHLKLEEVAFSGSLLITDEGISQLNKDTINSLNLSHCNQIKGESLHVFKNLSSLTVGYIDIRNEAIIKLADTPLKHLSLTNCPSITGKGLSDLKNLNSLSLKICRSISDESFEEIKNLTRLQTLKISDSKAISDQALLKIKALPLDRLELYNCSEISGKGISEMQNLRTLVLVNCRSIDDDVCDEIEKLQNIRTLNLTSSHITDKGLKKLSGLQNIENLNFSSCTGITQEGIIGLKTLKNLRELNLMMCFKVDMEFVKDYFNNKVNIQSL